MLVGIAGVLAVLLVLALYDVTQRQHAILRNFPIVGHFRYWLEAVGPELRQYIVTDNNEDRPFNATATVGLRVGQAREQLLRLRLGQRHGAAAELLDYQARHLSAAKLPPGESGIRPADLRIPCGPVLGSGRRRSGAFLPASVIKCRV